jgi:hypothetical protein
MDIQIGTNGELLIASFGWAEAPAAPISAFEAPAAPIPPTSAFFAWVEAPRASFGSIAPACSIKEPQVIALHAKVI